MQLYFDFQMRRKADHLADELASLDTASRYYHQKKTEYAAVIANISNELLRPVVQAMAASQPGV